MDSKKYIGMDVHKESISIAVMNGAGFCSLSMGCAETCRSRLKKEPRRPGCTTC
jgi:hypothetical protein